MSDPLFNKLDELEAQFNELTEQLNDPDVLTNPDKLRQVTIKRAALANVCQPYATYKTILQDIIDLQGIIELDPDEELKKEAREEIPQLAERADEMLEQIKGDLVTSDDRAIGSVIMEIRPGVGGDESAIWVGDLLSMYEHFAGNQHLKWEVMDYAGADMGGYKHVTINIKGEGVWQLLGYEGGTHCVKRVPETESQGRIHTSTATVAVLPEPEAVEINIPDDEVKIDITTSQGPGGQNVNKVATAVKMLHIPTGIEVRMQDTKSQQQNKERARQLLRARVHEHFQKQKDAQRAEARSEMIGRGDRGERIRTYRYKDNLCVDHRVNQSFNLMDVLSGNMTPLVHSLIEHDKAQRLANL